MEKRRDLKLDEQELYEDLTLKLNIYLDDRRCKERIELLDDLIDTIIKHEDDEDKYNDWQF